MRWILSGIVILLIYGCGGENKDINTRVADSIRVELLKQIDTLEKFIELKPLTYSSAASLNYKQLLEEYGEQGAYNILKLNRLDASHLRDKDTLVIPDTIVANFLYYSPFPYSIQLAADIPKILFISQTIQAYAGFEYGVQVKWGPTSTGKKSTPTPNGLFHTNWKAEETISTSNDEWLLRWNFNIENLDGIAIHQYDMPGYPASHSCARLLEADAVWFYEWGEQWVLSSNENEILAYGSPVIIFGEYDFNGRRPWLYLSEDPHANSLMRDELKDILSPHLQTIINRQIERDSVITGFEGADI
jgi:hypothetical protein